MQVYTFKMTMIEDDFWSCDFGVKLNWIFRNIGIDDATLTVQKRQLQNYLGGKYFENLIFLWKYCCLSRTVFSFFENDVLI